jgi:hypothetical protein
VPSSRRSVLVGSLALVACRLRAHSVGPAVRQRAPAFALPDADGRVVALDALRTRGPAVLVFYRGDW